MGKIITKTIKKDGKELKLHFAVCKDGIYQLKSIGFYGKNNDKEVFMFKKVGDK